MLTYENALEQLKNRETKKVENNTYLVNNHDGTISLRMKWPDSRDLPETDIMVMTPTQVTLYTGGFYTHTTKERLNAYSPVCVGQSKNIWYVSKNWNDGTNSLYYDGITFDYSGTQLSPVKSDEKVIKQVTAMKKRISTYADLCVAKIEQGIALPSNGDCWDCSMTEVKTHKPLGDCNNDTSHLTSHMTENTIVPSLIYNAMKEKGYSDQQFMMFCGYDESSISGKRLLSFSLKNIRKCIYDYMVKRLVTSVA